jgi:hypothetical protein
MRGISMQTVKSGMAVTASLVLSMLLAQGCGGDEKGAPSAAQVKDTCTKVCQKLSSCQGLTPDCATFCKDDGSGNGNAAIPPGCNTSATISKVQACTNETCAAFQGCLDNATSACDSGTGGTTSSGGTGSGTGGKTSSGGTGSSTGGKTSSGGTSTGTGGAGSGDCSVCTKANACCVALAAQQGEPASSCDSLTAAMCTSAGTDQSVVIMSCQAILMAGVSLNLAACK